MRTFEKVDHGNMDNVIPHHLFPTIIYEFCLNINNHDKNNMLTYIKNYNRIDEEAQNAFNLQSNQTQPLAQTNDDLQTMSYFKKFKDEIIKLNKNILDSLEYEYDDIIITNMWGNVMTPGEVHPPHTHSNNFLSGVFYLQADDQSGNITFFDPRPQAEVWQPRRKKGLLETCGAIGYDPKENNGFIFPSWLQHWVERTGSERVSISWNILVKGHYGDPNTLKNADI